MGQNKTRWEVSTGSAGPLSISDNSEFSTLLTLKSVQIPNGQDRVSKVKLSLLVDDFVIISLQKASLIGGGQVCRIKISAPIKLSHFKILMNKYQVVLCDFLEIEPHGKEFASRARFWP